MVLWCVRLVTAVCALIAMPAAAQTHIQPRLLTESSVPAAGSTVTIALEMRTEKGWHGYWSNPGEAGFAPRLTWNLPKGVSIGAPAYPVPKTLLVAGLMNYVFEADHALLLDLKLPAGLTKGVILPVKLDAEWLACTDQVCVPEKGSFAINLTIGGGGRDGAAPIDGFRAKLPAPLGSTASFARENGQLRLAIPFPADASIGTPHFFPATSGLIVDAAPQMFSRSGDRLILSVAAPKETVGAVGGVLSLGNGRGLVISARAGVVPRDGVALSTSAPTGLTAILLAIGGAILGGLILNVMPCVFPIVSLKALSLARAGGDEAAAKREALAYTGGVILTCVALGAVVLGLRAAGTQVGWAFQLQDPRIVFFLLLLATAITLNLAGTFELRAFAGGEALAGRAGVQGSFWTGVLAAFVATPCTGPFMAAALGAALVLPVAAALAVFAGLGAGLALPFLAIGFVPALRRLIPKPGPWMAKFQRFLAIPMALTVVALLWLVYQQQGNIVGDWALVTVAVIGALAFAMRFRETAGGRPVVMAAIMGVMLVGGAVAIKTDRVNANLAVADAGIPFSASRLASLRTEGRPVFLYFTADWCLTCKVNEKSAIETTLARDAFKAGGVTTMTGDWTNGDPVITRFLNENGASGVPLYLYYPKGGGEPRRLPQILTPGLLASLTSS